MNHPHPHLPHQSQRRLLLTALLGGALAPWRLAQAASAMNLSFREKSYLHRWSRAGQHEFTPAEDADLKRWRDMLTVNVHAGVQTGEALADVANRVLGNYQRAGKVLQTRSTPRTPARPAEHLIVAVLGSPDFLEAAFARCLLDAGRGVVVVASHRVYGAKAGPAMSDWLAANGQACEQALMAWKQLPDAASLQRLPQSPG